VIKILIQSVSGPNREVIVDGKFNAVEAIVRLQSAIDELRRLAAPVFDASWGEQPMPLLAPRAEELSTFLNPRP
jgi:hypothetical protein